MDLSVFGHLFPFSVHLFTLYADNWASVISNSTVSLFLIEQSVQTIIEVEHAILNINLLHGSVA